MNKSRTLDEWVVNVDYNNCISASLPALTQNPQDSTDLQNTLWKANVEE